MLPTSATPMSLNEQSAPEETKLERGDSVKAEFTQEKTTVTVDWTRFPCWDESDDGKGRGYRVFQAMGLSRVQAFSANLVVLNKKSVNLALTSNQGINSLAVSKTVLAHFLSKSKGSDFLRPRFAPAGYSLLATLSVSSMAGAAEAGPAAIFDNRLMYPIDASPSLNETGLVLSDINSSLFSTSAHSSSSIRSILIYITLLNALSAN